MATHRGMYDFVAKEPNMLSFKKGDLFSIISRSSNGWATVTNRKGEKGLVPETYLESVLGNDEEAPVKGAPYVVLYDFRAKDAYQLTITRGDKVTMVDKYTKDWWSMKDSTGKTGMVPAAYVKYSPENDNLEDSKQEKQSKEAISEVLLSIDRAIENLHTEATVAGGMYSAQQRSTLNALVAHRQNVVEENRSPSPNYSVLNSETEDMHSGQTQAQLTPRNNSSSKLDRGSPRRKAPPPPRQTKSPPMSSTATAANLETLDLAGVQLRSHGSDMASSKQRPRSEMIVQRAAPPPPKRVGSLSIRSTPPPTSTSPVPVVSITEVSEQEQTRAPHNGSTFDVVESVAVGKPVEDPGIESGLDKLEESKEIEVKSVVEAVTREAEREKEIEVNTVVDAAVGEAEREKETEVNTVVDAAVGEAEREEETVQLATNAPEMESVKILREGLDATLSLSNEDSGLVSAIDPAAKRRASSSSDITKEPLETVEEKIAELPSDFPPELSAEMVETMREITDLSYTKSLSAVEGMLVFIGEKIPSVATVMVGLINALHQSQVDVGEGGAMKAGGSRDLERLRELFFEIQEVRDDSQQRGWAVHDDSQAISQSLNQLLQILCDADPSVSRVAIQEDRYENVLILIAYYQLEARVPIRLLLLKIFTVLCTLDHDVISVLLSSTLPNELGRDIQQNLHETQKVLLSSTVSTMIFSTAEAVPLTIYDQWDLGYVQFLFNAIEEAPDSDHQEEIPDSFLTLLLSYNQHFHDPSSNLVMKALKENMESSNPKVFGEKLMLLVNRGDDPVAISDPCCPDSLLKMMLDLFSDKLTAGIFYTTDFMVLIDIITRQLSDLSPGDKLRPHYLELLFRIVGTTDYSSHKHRQDNITQCLQWINEEEGNESEADKAVVRKIWSEFPDLFHISSAV